VETAPFRPFAEGTSDREEVKRVGLGHVVALADLAENAESLWAKRAAVQAARRRGDREILALLDAPFQTNCLDESYMDVQRTVQRVFGVEETFGAVRDAARVLVISNDTVNARMAGPGIRAWEMARILARQNPVTLAVPNEDPLEADGLRVVSYGSKTGRGLRELAAEHDVLV